MEENKIMQASRLSAGLSILSDMKKSSYNWIWKWHFISGLVSFPIIFVLAITGIIYLFKDQYEKPRYASIREVEIGVDRLSYDEQWLIAQDHSNEPISSIVLPLKKNQATEFISGRFSGKSSLFVDPYSGKVTGTLATRETDMFKVRKLHGELLMGSFGTKIVELIGSWLIVLIMSGLFLFFPRRKKDWIKLFRIRLTASRPVLFRDLHQVGGFWFSIVLLLILSGGMPWTDVWGDGFKWIQKQTGTGYPIAWNGVGINSINSGERIALDQVVDYAESLALPGEVSITFPKSPSGVFSLHNIFYRDQSQQVAVHVDPYSGKPLAYLEWKDVGILMRGRMWAMAFHQGQLGIWNWMLVLVTAIGLLVLSGAAVSSYFLRKNSEDWSVPQTASIPAAPGWYALIILIGMLLPLFGLSIIFIWGISALRRKGVELIQNKRLLDRT
ncbi:PepSY domain-containing protein [Reichenbachiella sp.]|uniref:PepSY-associated TM helix domain-containing protein n=1 Tax=Reichenbachiella sp. TaxID=2184521 RepID=UPI0032975D9D